MATLVYKEGQNLNFAISAETVLKALDNATAKLAPAPTIPSASKEHPWDNSLGMQFVPVEGTEVLFSIWDTRVQDFQAFVEQTKYEATGGMWSLGKDGWKQGGGTWRAPGFQQGATHPVVGVNWTDSKAFCDWLTKTEHARGLLPKQMVYRLPTDEEWSLAVGLGYEVGFTPEERNRRIPQVFPWGKEWPPPSGSGNYAGDEFKIGNEPTDWIGIKGYNDGWPRTSPAGSFRPNAFGLYDMGGNVQQWCEDWYDSNEKVVRGSSWAMYVYPAILSGNRVHGNPADRQDSVGFRCVVAPVGSPSRSGSAHARPVVSAAPSPTPSEKLARQYYSEGLTERNSEKAVEEYTAAILAKPDFAEAYFERAKAYSALGNYSGAIADFSEVLRLKPVEVEPGQTVDNTEVSRAEIYYQLGDYCSTIAFCSDAIRLSPSNMFAYFYRGLGYFGLKQYTKAVEDYSAAIQLWPGYSAAYESRARAYQSMGDVNKANADFKKAKQIRDHE